MHSYCIFYRFFFPVWNFCYYMMYCYFYDLFYNFSALIGQVCLNSKELYSMRTSELSQLIKCRHETEKNQKKRKIATCEGAQRPNLLGWVREGGSPSRRKFCNFRYWKSCFNAEKNQKKRKIATCDCEGAQRPNLLGVGSGGGFPLPQKILQF